MGQETTREKKEVGDRATSGRRRQHAPSEPMYVSYAKEFQVQGGRLESESLMLRQINRAVVYYLGAYFCDIDFEASQCNQAARGIVSGGSSASLASAPTQLRPLSAVVRRLGGLKQSRWKRQLKFGWIPRTVLLSFCLFQIYLMVTSYYQYQFDFDVLRLLELQRRVQLTGGDATSGNGTYTLLPPLQQQQMVMELKLRMVQTKTKLDWLGADFSHVTILAECFYVVIATLSLLMYVPLYLHHRFQEPFDRCHIVRDLIDRPRELRLCKQMTERQVAKFLDSSRVYYENIISFPDTPLGAWQAGPARLAVQSLPGDVAPSGRAAKREQEILGLVRDMHACGALMPPYRMRAWIRRRTLTEFCLHLGQAIFVSGFYLIIVTGFVTLANYERHSRSDSNSDSSSSQMLIYMATLGPLVVATPNMIVHPPLVVTLVSEHIRYIQYLRSMIHECISVNSLIARQLNRRQLMLHHQHQMPALGGYGDDCAGQPDNPQPTSDRIQSRRKLSTGSDGSGTWQFRGLERTMNSNLIFVILHYKIFVTQLMPMRHSLGFKFLVGLSLLFSVPLITRIHQPYVRKLYEGRLTDTQIRIFAFLMSSSVLLPINLVCMPICHMFARCKFLYRDLASLMAHISEMKLLDGRRGTNIYDSHTQSYLLKELSDSKRLLEQLQVRAGGISGNYPNLIKALLWFGLIAISIMAERSSYSGGGGAGDAGVPGNGNVESQGELFSGLFSDPLGVYSEVN